MTIGGIKYGHIKKISVTSNGAELEFDEMINQAYATISVVREIGKLNLELASELSTRLGYVDTHFTLEELLKYKIKISSLLDSLEVNINDKERITNIIKCEFKFQMRQFYEIHDSVIENLMSFSV
jgi:hypothetical protein